MIRRSFVKAVLSSVTTRIIPMALFVILAAIGQLLIPYLIRTSLSSLEGGSPDTWAFLEQGLFLAAVLVFSSAFDLLFLQQSYGCIVDVTTRINDLGRVHSLTLPGAYLRRRSKRMLNLFQNDAEIVAEAIPNLLEALRGIVLLIGSFVLLVHLIQWGALITFLALIFLLPLQFFINRKIGAKQLHLSRRVDVMTGLLQSATSDSDISDEQLTVFERKTIKTKRHETALRKRKVLWEGLGTFVFQGTTAFLGVATFAFLWFDNRLSDASLIFSCISVFSLLERPFSSFANRSKALTASFVSAKRISQFLNLKVGEKSEVPCAQTDAKPDVERKVLNSLGQENRIVFGKIFSTFINHGGRRLKVWIPLVGISTVLSILGPWLAMYLISWVGSLPVDSQSASFQSYILASLLGACFLFSKNILWFWQGIVASHNLFCDTFAKWIRKNRRSHSDVYVVNTLVRDLDHVQAIWTHYFHALLQSVVVSVSAVFILLYVYPAMGFNVLVACVLFSILLFFYRDSFLPLRRNFYRARDFRGEGMIRAFTETDDTNQAVEVWERGVLSWAEAFDDMNRCSLRFYFGIACVLGLVTAFGWLLMFASFESGGVSVAVLGLVLTISLQCWQALGVVTRSVIHIESKGHSLTRIRVLSESPHSP